MHKSLSALFLIALLSSGCAKRADQIAPAYVSPLVYQTYSCEQLAAEANRVSSRAAQVMGVQDKRATDDAVATGLGVIIFWPALLFIRGGGATEAEVAQLKGQMDAVEQAAIQKNCGFQFETYQ